LIPKLGPSSSRPQKAHPWLKTRRLMHWSIR